MANCKFKPNHVLSSNPQLRDPQLQSLISTLCAPRRSLIDADVCRLIVDGRLQWAAQSRDDNTAWLYLPLPARACRQAGCLILLAE